MWFAKPASLFAFLVKLACPDTPIRFKVDDRHLYTLFLSFWDALIILAACFSTVLARRQAPEPQFSM